MQKLPSQKRERPKIQVRCPICDAPMGVRSVADWPFFPFCGKRCKMVDLGRWLKEAYGVEASEADDLAEVDTP